MPASRRLRIGIDFDGTLADTIEAAARYLRDFDGIDLEPHERTWPPGRERIGGERFAKMIADPRFFDRLGFVTSAEAVTRELIGDADVFLVTARNPQQTEPVRRWLDSRDLELSGVVATSYASKVEACRELQLDLHFDDMLAHTADLMRETDTALALLAAPWNDLQPSDGDIPASEPRVHDGWDAFHRWVRATFEDRLGSR